MDNNSLRVGTILITGISASGKSTLGEHLKDDLIKSGVDNLKFIDGEDFRAQLTRQGKHYGYSMAERNELGLEIAHMALEYNRKGIICIISGSCPVREIREQMRAIVGNLMEVYLDCPVDICAQRDYKGNYAKAFQGLCDNFLGVSASYQRSDAVELTLHTGKDSVEECSRVLHESAATFLGIANEKEFIPNV